MWTAFSSLQALAWGGIPGRPTFGERKVSGVHTRYQKPWAWVSRRVRVKRLGYWITYSVAARKEAKELVVNSSRMGRDEIHRAPVEGQQPTG